MSQFSVKQKTADSVMLDTEDVEESRNRRMMKLKIWRLMKRSMMSSEQAMKRRFKNLGKK